MIKLLKNGRLPIVDMQLMFISLFYIGEQHFYFAIEPISLCFFGHFVICCKFLKFLFQL
jgi:hypothetical protein